ncbi:uncharacterized protein VNE69_01068 [Vairimorpha necatrix]|uniref:Uncharacterized protein n=1 Tax=Vairimorpha necatrix TaxID=6039 RepID=A0AAX4J817_9MICR
MGGLLCLKHEHNQTICEYIKFAEELAKPYKLKSEEKIKIILDGPKGEILDVQRLIIRSKVLDEVLINDIFVRRDLSGRKKEEKGKEGTRKKVP